MDSEEELNCLQAECSLGEECNQVQLVSFVIYLCKTVMPLCKLGLASQDNVKDIQNSHNHDIQTLFATVVITAVTVIT